MSSSTDNNISIKECSRMNKYKVLKIEIEKVWHRKITIMPVIVGALGMINKETNKHINKIPGNARLYEIQKILHFAELLISLEEYSYCDWKNNTQKRQQKHKYIYILSSTDRMLRRITIQTRRTLQAGIETRLTLC